MPMRRDPLQKGGKGGKKGKGKGEGEEGVELTPEEREARAKLRIEALERELVQRQDVVNRALQSHNDMRQRQAELLKDFEDEKQTTFAITADMTRQYKSMQEELMKRINTLETTIMEQKDQLELARQANEELTKQKDQELALKDATIADLKMKMEDMSQEFGEMLKETLDKMSEKIEATSNEWEQDAGGGGNVEKKLEELGVTSQ
jgi:DNA repair exonuclease SbcCD ATPase subunit